MHRPGNYMYAGDGVRFISQNLEKIFDFWTGTFFDCFTSLPFVVSLDRAISGFTPSEFDIR